MASDELQILQKACYAAGAAVMPYFREMDLEINSKADSSPVSQADIAGEQAAIAVIENAFPDDGIIGEEGGAKQPDAKRQWLIDPIDGTKSFVMGNPLFGCLIGLLDAGEPILGAAYMPALNELYYGDGKESFLLKDKKQTRLFGTQRCQNLAQARLATTAPTMFDEHTLPIFEHLSQQSGWVRFGGDCYNYLLLCAGFVDIVIEDDLEPYDSLPLIAILRGAGCVVTDWQGGAVSSTNAKQIIATANADLHQQALSCISNV